jgi:fructokinase
MGTAPDNLLVVQIPTTTPEATIAEVISYFRKSPKPLQAIGIGSFGPVDLRPESAAFGCITSTPKAGWKHFNLAGAIAGALDVPVGFDTDVNAAALGEARWGAAAGLTDFIYVTVGTGIGGGAVVNGSILHGLMHAEMGHIRVPHDISFDPFAGNCPFHGDCFEGLASGPAMQARWGVSADQLPANHAAWKLEAHYLALGLVSLVCALSPQRIILGGGVMRQTQLFPMIRKELASLLNGYIQAPELTDHIDSYVVPPKLGDRAGVLGSLVLAERAFYRLREKL